MAPGASPVGVPDIEYPYALSLLFLIFMAIVLAWEITVGMLAWLLDGMSHQRSILLSRLREELLALGVVSLVLAFISTPMTKWCTYPFNPSELHEPTKEEKEYCPRGEHQIMPSAVIGTGHYLLFWIAIVQILYTLLGVFFTSRKFRRMFVWEQIARRNQNGELGGVDSVVPAGDSMTAPKPLPASRHAGAPAVTLEIPNQSLLPGSGEGGYASSGPYVLATPRTKIRALWRRTCSTWCSCCHVLGAMKAHEYTALRLLMLLRVSTDHHAAHELHAMNLAVASEQMVYKEIGHVHAHTWLQVIAISLLVLYYQYVLQELWMTPVCLLFMGVLALKLRSVVHQATAIIHRAFTPENAPPGAALPSPSMLIRHGSASSHGGFVLRTPRDTSGSGVDLTVTVSAATTATGPPSATQRHSAAVRPAALEMGMTRVARASLVSRHGNDTFAVMVDPPRAAAQPPSGVSSPEAPSAPTPLSEDHVSVVTAMDGHHASDRAAPWALDSLVPGSPHNPLAHKVADAQAQITSLFWLRWPHMFLWMLEMVLVCSAAVTTIMLFLLSSTSVPQYRRNLALFIPLLLINLALTAYMGWVLIPQYAVLTTAATTPMHHILHHLRWANVVNEEEHHGVARLVFHVLERMKQGCRERKREKRQSAAAQERAVARFSSPAKPRPASMPALAVNSAAVWVRPSRDPVQEALIREARKQLPGAWVGALAPRAGVVLPTQSVDAAHAFLAHFAPLYLGLVKVWRRKAQVALGVARAPPGGYKVQGDVYLEAFKQVFESLDDNASGSLSAKELQDVMAQQFNVKPTQSELNAMIWEVTPATGDASASGPASGNSGSSKRRVTFLGFVGFAAFAFLDSAKHKGAVDARAVAAVLSQQGMEVPHQELVAMFTLAQATGSTPQVRPAQFIAVLQDVVLQTE